MLGNVVPKVALPIALSLTLQSLALLEDPDKVVVSTVLRCTGIDLFDLIKIVGPLVIPKGLLHEEAQASLSWASEASSQPAWQMREALSPHALEYLFAFPMRMLLSPPPDDAPPIAGANNLAGRKFGLGRVKQRHCAEGQNKRATEVDAPKGLAYTLGRMARRSSNNAFRRSPSVCIVDMGATSSKFVPRRGRLGLPATAQHSVTFGGFLTCQA